MERTQAEIEDVIARADEAENEGSQFPGMTYEQGVSTALRWISSVNADDPLAE